MHTMNITNGLDDSTESENSRKTDSLHLNYSSRQTCLFSFGRNFKLKLLTFDLILAVVNSLPSELLVFINK